MASTRRRWKLCHFVRLQPISTFKKQRCHPSTLYHQVLFLLYRKQVLPVFASWFIVHLGFGSGEVYYILILHRNLKRQIGYYCWVVTLDQPGPSFYSLFSVKWILPKIFGKMHGWLLYGHHHLLMCLQMPLTVVYRNLTHYDWNMQGKQLHLIVFLQQTSIMLAPCLNSKTLFFVLSSYVSDPPKALCATSVILKTDWFSCVDIVFKYWFIKASMRVLFSFYVTISLGLNFCTRAQDIANVKSMLHTLTFLLFFFSGNRFVEKQNDKMYFWICYDNHDPCVHVFACVWKWPKWCLWKANKSILTYAM